MSQALSNGHRKLLINAKIPGLNPALEQIFPFSSSLLNIVSRSLITQTPNLSNLPSACLLFSSSGSSAQASAQYARDDSLLPSIPSSSLSLWTASYAQRDMGGNSDGCTSEYANVIVNPVTSRGDPIMDALEMTVQQNPQATWILLNPDLGADRAAVGMRESARRADFQQQFTTAFYYRPLFEIQRPKLDAVERGALLFTFGGPWRVFALVDGAFVPSAKFDTCPSDDRIEAALKETTWAARRAEGGSQAQAEGLDAEIAKLFARLFGK